MFTDGTQPTNGCNTHIWANVNRLNNKLATPSTPGFLTRKQVFIKKDHPNSATADYHVVLPSGYDTGYSGSNNHAEQNVDENVAPPENNEQNAPDNTNVNNNTNDNVTNNVSPVPTPPVGQNNAGTALPAPDTNNRNIAPRTH